MATATATIRPPSRPPNLPAKTLRRLMQVKPRAMCWARIVTLSHVTFLAGDLARARPFGRNSSRHREGRGRPGLAGYFARSLRAPREFLREINGLSARVERFRSEPVADHLSNDQCAGIEFIRQLRHLDLVLPAIILAANIDSASTQDASQFGAIVVETPPNGSTLCCAIEAVLPTGTNRI